MLIEKKRKEKDSRFKRAKLCINSLTHLHVIVGYAIMPFIASEAYGIIP